MITLVGELDFPACVQATPSLALLAIAGRDLTFDMALVTFMDAAGLNLLQSVRQKVLAGGGTVEARGIQPPVRRVLELTGTDVQFVFQRRPREHFGHPRRDGLSRG
ncbi:STAS domain-containing protein [Streptomyces hygroscopicus]|uniref:STAS domain-containing protein n=1 Tax=Streptomyces hygroscopicus TaxID=1912 RepID=UPI00223F6A6E|nr:STAS domain-containing protein [Streptomyces hygroscopicus]